MANHHGIDVSAHDAAGVVDGFAFGHGRKGKTGRVAHGSAKTAESGAETDARSRAGFKKQVAQYGAFQNARYFLAAGNGLHQIGNAEQFLDRFPGELDRKSTRLN